MPNSRWKLSPKWLYQKFFRQFFNFLKCCIFITVSAAYTGELGTGHFLRYKWKSGLTGDFYFINEFLGFKKPPL